MKSIISSPKLVVLTGPSGVGKGTLVKKLLERHPDIWLSVSATTRAPRSGEVDGRDYVFLEKVEFQKLADEGGFLEWAEFAGNSYGTPLKEVQGMLALGRPVLLEIELEGARNIRKTFPEALQIFIAPPTLEELEKRIRGRATDDETSIKLRLKRALSEIQAKDEFDSIIINDKLERALLLIENQIGY